MTTQLDGIIKRWWVALVFGILAIGLGVFMLFNPLETYVALSYAFAVYFIAYGIYKAYMTYKERDMIPAWGWSFALALFTLLLGLILLIPGMATGTFVYYVSFGVLFMGVNTCATSFALKDAGDKYWGWSLAIGIITILLAFFMIMAPVISIGIIAFWFGILFIVLGVQCCFLAYRLSVLKSEEKKAQKAAHATK